MTIEIDGAPLGVGSASGPAMVLDEPLSFWGGFDPMTGKIKRLNRKATPAAATIFPGRANDQRIAAQYFSINRVATP